MSSPNRTGKTRRCRFSEISMKCFQTIGDVKGNRAGKLAMVLLCLATMVACQGVSTSKSASVQPTSGGTLSLSGTSLDFGSVTAGTSKTLSMTVTNTGAASITVSSATFSSQYFSLSAPTLPVRFSPARVRRSLSSLVPTRLGHLMRRFPLSATPPTLPRPSR